MTHGAGDEERVLSPAGQVVDAAVPEHVRVDLAAQGFQTELLDRPPDGDAGLGEKRRIFMYAFSLVSIKGLHHHAPKELFTKIQREIIY